MTVVLLAAGKSSRTSVMKQLYPIKGEYLINRQIRKLRGYGYNVASCWAMRMRGSALFWIRM